MQRSNEACANVLFPILARLILLRSMQRPRTEERVGGVDLESMSERELERLYAGVLRIAALPPNQLQALLLSLLADEADA